MKRLTALTASALIFAAPAFAQTVNNQPDVPGSEQAIDNQNAVERTNVAAENEPNVMQPDQANAETEPAQQMNIPGNTKSIDNSDAEERDAIASGNAASTEDMAENENSDVLVPGSGATFSQEEGVDSLEGEALQDDATTDAVRAN